MYPEDTYHTMDELPPGVHKIGVSSNTTSLSILYLRVQDLSSDRLYRCGGKGSQEAGALAIASPTVTSHLLRIKQFGQDANSRQSQSTKGEILEENKLIGDHD